MIENNTDSPVIAGFNSLVENNNLLAGLAKLKISTPSAVQLSAIPEIKTGSDLIVQAQTGSGKTLAFVLPILEKLLSAPRSRKTELLILTPTRELALQVKQVISSLTQEIVPACIIGGANIARQIKQIKNDPRIIIGTPGRLQDLMRRRCYSLHACKYFILDEADEMLSMGFAPSVQELLSHIPEEAQGLFFSATMNTRVSNLAKTFLNNHKTITIKTRPEDRAKIEHLFCRAAGNVTSKTDALCWLFENQNVSSAIIFCNTKADTEQVERTLQRKGFNAKRINSDLNQRQRARVIDSLKSGQLDYLVATDVAARGIDIKNLSTVINYSIHKQSEVYVHRTGRTGRAGASGKAISIIGPRDFSAFHGLRKQLKLEVSEITAPN
jgi:superfamily II DNA/RNA helicase